MTRPDRRPRRPLTPLLRCYPRAWRARYGAEVADLLAREAATPRLALDLLLGALDAHLQPQAGARRGPHRALRLALLAALLLAGGLAGRQPAAQAVAALVAPAAQRAPGPAGAVATSTPPGHRANRPEVRPE